MKPKDLTGVGIPREAHREAFAYINFLREQLAVSEDYVDNVPAVLRAKLLDAARHTDRILSTGHADQDPELRELCERIKALREDPHTYSAREEPAPWVQFGHSDDIEDEAIAQMVDACNLPVAVRGALMPDAHLGYGLPIGGVLATRGVVIPYAVGVDIACRMRITITDLPISLLTEKEDKLIKAIERNTRFGTGAHFERKRKHAVMDADWDVSPVTKYEKQKAWSQLGTSGGGNHFVEFGYFTDVNVEEYNKTAGVFQAPDTYLALMTHSGSRGVGHKVATHYSKLAEKKCRGLPKHLRHLAWLSLDSEEGKEYWNAMKLMGRYAAANHELIHENICHTLGAEVVEMVENHHNFAWLEEHDGEEVVVHRKGATPAHEGVKGVIPGSMGTPAYVVMGKGNSASLCSASHGAGRRMGRAAAKKAFTRKEMDDFLAERGVKLISGGLDECPQAYKDIESVMAAQEDLVQVLGRFIPKLVKMAP